MDRRSRCRARPTSAIAVYERFLTVPSVEFASWHALYLAGVHESLARLYDGRGELDDAARHYARFVELWRDADPELQPRVEAAQARLQEIHDERG